MNSVAETVALEGRTKRVSRVSWRRSVALAVLALWLPFVAVAIGSHRVRRVLEDFWFWPGIFPGSLLLDTLYTTTFVVFAIGHVVLWALVIRRYPLLGMLGAILCSSVSAIRLVLLLAI